MRHWRTEGRFGEDGAICPVSECGSWSPDVMAMFAFRLDSAPHIAAAYGDTASQYALGVVCQMLTDLVGDGGRVHRDQNGFVTVLIWEVGLLGPGTPKASCIRFVRSFASTIARHPIWFGESCFHVSVSGAWSLFSAEQFGRTSSVSSCGLLGELSAIRFDGEPVASGEKWARRYRSDMESAVRLLSGIAKNRLLFTWQPIRSGSGDGATLYHECVLRDCELDAAISPAEGVPALERLGLVGELDYHVVSRVVEELECQPDACLGVNISAQSAHLDGWWLEFAERLRERPDIASRLVIEITETARFPDISQAAIFAAEMKRMGVRIALDDFGVGHASIRTLFALQPDIIKVDGFFLRRAACSDRGQEAFTHLVGLASSIASTVIVEGVETAADDTLVANSGVMWRQGEHLGGASVIRPWLRVALSNFDQAPSAISGRGQA